MHKPPRFPARESTGCASWFPPSPGKIMLGDRTTPNWYANLCWWREQTHHCGYAGLFCYRKWGLSYAIRHAQTCWKCFSVARDSRNLCSSRPNANLIVLSYSTDDWPVESPCMAFVSKSQGQMGDSGIGLCVRRGSGQITYLLLAGTWIVLSDYHPCRSYWGSRWF